MVLENGGVIIVDRGWVKGDAGRQQWPVLSTPFDPITLSGQIYYPPETSWLLGTGLELKRADLAIIETLNIAMMSEFLHKSLYPFIIRQSSDSPGGYICDWSIVASMPERHIGYAIQWFLFACIAGILFVVLNVKKKHETT
jgi:surfeit locus 1 family protein